MTIPTRRIFTLSQITARLQEILQPATRKRFWMRAEVSSGKERSGTFYCDLVESDESGQQIAKLRGTIWKSDLTTIRQKFAEAGLDLELEDGTEVCLLCSLRFHALHGLSLAVHDADPEFALGELELRRRRILLKLEEEGLFEPNKLLPVPLLPQRIGVVTSIAGAAFQDFVRTLQQSGFGFTVFAADASVQGRFAERDVMAAIKALMGQRVDVIAVIRGGGSRTELAFLDNESIARVIAASPIPVWTGIGHEIDTSILDFVANQAFKTPTAVAVALVERFSEVQNLVNAARTRLKSTWQLRIDATRHNLQRSHTGLSQGTRKLLELTRAELNNRKVTLTRGVKSRRLQERGLILAARTQLVSQCERTLSERQRQVMEIREMLQHHARHALEIQRLALTTCRERFRVTQYAQVIDQRHQQLQARAARFRLERVLDRLRVPRESLSTKLRLVRAADPKRSLKRGFSLSYDAQGKLVTSIQQLTPGAKLAVHVRDGIIHSTTDALKARDDDR